MFYATRLFPPGRLPLGLAGGLLFCLIAAGVPAPAQLDNERCLRCHGDQGIAGWSPQRAAAMVAEPPEGRVLRRPEAMADLYIDAELYADSAHGEMNCTQCHLIERTPHLQRVATLNCADCHAEAASEMERGVHAEGPDSPLRMPHCADCHGPAHEVRPIEPRTQGRVAAMSEACIVCHDGRPAETWIEGVHGRALLDKGLSASAGCADCHGSHAILPATDPDSLMHPFNDPQTCGRCHDGVTEIYYGSVHGRHLLEGDPEAASCTSCHASHGIGPVDEPFMMAAIQECSTCHYELGRTYLLSYHGKAATLGEPSVAACSSCHGAHDILPPDDPASRVAEANLIRTCGECHPRANANFVQYLVHVDPRDPNSPPQVYYAWLIMTALLLSVLAVFVTHGLLWLQRSFIERLRNPRGFHIAPAGERRIRRFDPIHLYTHGLIVVSFMGLVITGFPLKYSHEPWAQWMVSAMGGVPAIGLAHRVFAVISFFYVGIHLVWLGWFFAKRCPRPRWRFVLGPDSMVMNWGDVKEAFAMLRWFLWLGPRPKFGRWTYFEKFDYWGEAWGMFLIGGTGLILWFPEFFTRWLPGWVLNTSMVIHSIEALLAASVIFLVHFFNTHLRPEKFPVDMAMLTGYITESEMKEERPVEYERLVANGELESRIVQPMALKWRLIGAALGIMTFTIGIVLIVLIIRSELDQVLRG